MSIFSLSFMAYAYLNGIRPGTTEFHDVSKELLSRNLLPTKENVRLYKDAIKPAIDPIPNKT